MYRLFSFIMLVAFSATLSFAGSKKDIVDVAVEAGSFKTLVAAVKAADLVSTLKGAGPFTVLAPSDEAFAKLPKGTLESLLMPENKDQLIAILSYHVIPGKINSSEIVKNDFAKTVNGQRVKINADKGSVAVNNANVVTVDIMASNGIIHVIDQVILPETKNIAEVAQANGSFKTLLTALKATGLDKALSGKGPFTVFAPTDDAFAKLPKGTLDNLLKPENKTKLADILKYHVTSNRTYSPDVIKSGKLKTLLGQNISFSLDKGKAFANESQIIITDIETANGVIHVIDAVLLPSEKSTAAIKAEELIQMAVNHGVPLYNHGNAQACAAVYQVACAALMNMSGELPEKTIRPVEMAMTSYNESNDWSDRAWTLRRGLDKAMVSLNNM